MLVKKLVTANENLLLMSSVDGEVLVGYFTMRDSKLTYLRPSDENEWDHAINTWKTRPTEERIEIDPFPYLRALGNTLYAFYLKKHPYAGIVGRFIESCYQDNRTTYETLNWEQAIDNKYGNDKVRWLKGAGKNIQKSFEEIKGWDKEDECYADEFGVTSAGTICWVYFTCQKVGCECIGGWPEGSTEDMVATFKR
jgi:hypothetical protein